MYFKLAERSIPKQQRKSFAQIIKIFLAISAIAEILSFHPVYGQTFSSSISEVAQSPISSKRKSSPITNPKTYFERGLKRIESEDYQGAIADFNQVLKIQPNNAYAYLGRGLGNFSLAEYQAAKTDFDKALAITPDIAYAYYFRGFTHYILEDKESAIADLHKASTLFKQAGELELAQKAIEAIESIQQNSSDRSIASTDRNQIL